MRNLYSNPSTDALFRNPNTAHIETGNGPAAVVWKSIHDRHALLTRKLRTLVAGQTSDQTLRETHIWGVEDPTRDQKLTKLTGDHVVSLLARSVADGSHRPLQEDPTVERDETMRSLLAANSRMTVLLEQVEQHLAAGKSGSSVDLMDPFLESVEKSRDFSQIS